MIRVPLILALSAALGAFTDLAHALTWEPHYEAAAAKSKAEKRDIFVFISGSDWNAASRVYKQRVIQSPALEALGRDFIWLEIDRPDKASPSQKELAKLNRTFEARVWNYPGVVLLDPEGRAYLKLETPAPDVAALLDMVRKARERKARRDAELALAARATGNERAKHLAAALEIMGEANLREGHHSHRALLDDLKKLDPKDATGTQRRLTFNPDALAERELWPILREKKFAEALYLVDKELADPRNNLKIRQQLLGLRFHVFQQQERLDDAVATLKQIITLDADSHMARLSRGYLDNITRSVVLAEAKWKPEHLRFFFAPWRLDAARWITGPGVYEIEFKRVDGEPLSVREVSIMSGESVLATAPMPMGKDIVELDLASLPAATKPWLKISAKGNGWFNSRGDILIRKK